MIQPILPKPIVENPIVESPIVVSPIDELDDGVRVQLLPQLFDYYKLPTFKPHPVTSIFVWLFRYVFAVVLFLVWAAIGLSALSLLQQHQTNLALNWFTELLVSSSTVWIVLVAAALYLPPMIVSIVQSSFGEKELSGTLLSLLVGSSLSGVVALSMLWFSGQIAVTDLPMTVWLSQNQMAVFGSAVFLIPMLYCILSQSDQKKSFFMVLFQLGMMLLFCGFCIGSTQGIFIQPEWGLSQLYSAILLGLTGILVCFYPVIQTEKRNYFLCGSIATLSIVICTGAAICFLQGKWLRMPDDGVLAFEWMYYAWLAMPVFWYLGDSFFHKQRVKWMVCIVLAIGTMEILSTIAWNTYDLTKYADSFLLRDHFDGHWAGDAIEFTFSKFEGYLN